MILAAPPPPKPPPLAVSAPAEREVSFAHIAGRVQSGDWAIVVRADEKLLVVKRVEGGTFDFVVALPAATPPCASASTGRTGNAS